MSRIGQSPITIPGNVEVNHQDNLVNVTGPKGSLSLSLPSLISLKKEDQQLTLARANNSKVAKSLHGTFRALLANTISGVVDGFEKNLELVGTGYRVAKAGTKLNLTLGFSHPIELDIPSQLEVSVEGNNKLKISGIDKQFVGQFAAKVRALRPPEPYKGKGIRYHDEVVRRKAGKAAKTAA